MGIFLCYSLLLKTGFLAECGAHLLARLVGEQIPGISCLCISVLRLQIYATVPWFLCGCWRSKLRFLCMYSKQLTNEPPSYPVSPDTESISTFDLKMIMLLYIYIFCEGVSLKCAETLNHCLVVVSLELLTFPCSSIDCADSCRSIMMHGKCSPLKAVFKCVSILLSSSVIHHKLFASVIKLSQANCAYYIM